MMMICPHCQKEIAENSNFCYHCGARQQASTAAPPPRSSMAGKRLMRSATEVKIAGVCAGVAEYFEIDPTVVRLLWVFLVLLPIPVVSALLAYIIAWIVMPKAPLPAVASAQAATPAAAANAPQAS